MSSACGCEHEPAAEIEELDRPWWKDPELLLPIFSGVALCTGLALDWSGLETPATVVFWVGLLLGAYTFAPGAIQNLVTKRKLGIGLLMTISAVGAVILGFVGEAAALAFLYSIAEALEDKAMDRAQGGLRALLKLVPQTTTVLRDGTAVEVTAKDLVVGELMLVRPGERIATDGIIRSGRSSIDTSAVTGESIPEEVAPGDEVPAAAINSAGVLEVETTAAGTDNSLTTLVDLVEQAQAEKGDRARIADRIARPLVPGVMILAVLVGVIGSLLGDPETWITRALVVLVAASPCALAISVPLTVVAAIGAASQFGVVIKSGAAFERLGGIRHLAVDKTGTLTRNQPEVTGVVPAVEFDRAQVLAFAAAVEQQSTHPLAAAIAAAVPEVPAAQDISEEAGHGIGGTVEGRRVLVGSPRWIDAGPLKADVERMESEGQTCVLVTVDDALAGAIGVRDELRPEVPQVVQTLRTNGVEVSMLTGDNTRTARALAEIAGIDDVRAELRPEDKTSIVAELSSKTPTAMIGDGINDAPALAGATVGIAMGATGSDAAIESADVAFTGHDLRLIPQALQHARRGSRIINQNIVLSLAIIIVLMPLAISGVLGLAAVVLVHEVAEVIVILNGLRAAQAKR
ncbi:heavy metal translocating P-type ATPase [Jonesia denitrificans]|uniref:Heavy metal translocating P-type ATPase n=1 Tax=Jonesia denitrificans (strain ATCC 14870 / DSM 20603 / BCRC 15368 / CIP 55.134 / JCM 11481 / NBRC 15587 / NCTC 10816 / Prevot 55134) TaxID=471856 RepID=C7R1X0_JONDD|nr:cation-translocating P-type ATPase [Jonesia denitrificans]ACV08438.1 heavy metal translocating P-type ATPase [Jonesia denitrificans DSM 20603]ASE07916.1 cadmium-translocating P-type ATPase [Jonesia denitrificans]QXB42525.1 cadmium-translocating P-type ATPase [Jonesia denitrificans]SQH20417.1 Zinc-transporting ATPase [Jonesia denitrificans]